MRLILPFILIALSSSTYAFTQKITNYNQLLTSLEQGDDVSAIIQMDNCTLKKKQGLQNPLDGASTRINFQVFSHYKVLEAGVERETIATSNTLFTEHRDLGPVYAYGRVRVFTDNQLEIHLTYYTATDFKAKGSTDLVCHIGDDAKAVSLFAKS